MENHMATLEPLNYITRAITAFKLGWSNDINAYENHIAHYTQVEKNIISKLIAENESKWISRFREELESYRPTIADSTQLITDNNGDVVKENDILYNHKTRNKVKLVILNDMYKFEAVYCETALNTELEDTCLSDYVKE